MTLRITNFKPGVLIEIQNQPYRVISASHKKLGRGPGMVKTKLKNLATGAILEKVFKGEQKVKEVKLEKTKAQYLYKDKENFYFMDSQTFEQFFLKSEILGSSLSFLKEGGKVEILSFKKEPVNINLPIKINLEVIETEPGLKGGRETPGTKRAVLETGYSLQVPLFIKEEDVIKVDTRNGSYVERVK